MQDGQRILLTTPSVLVGFRVEVYRAEGTTQWYTAVIVGYNESTKVRPGWIINITAIQMETVQAAAATRTSTLRSPDLVVFDLLYPF